jgi:TonB family protein
MKRADLNRFLVALGAALGFHLILALLLSFIPWEQTAEQVRSRGPVTVRLEQPEPSEQVPEEEQAQPEPEPQTKPEPERSREEQAEEPAAAREERKAREAPAEEEVEPSPAGGRSGGREQAEPSPQRQEPEEPRSARREEAEQPAPEPEETPASRQPEPEEQQRVEQEQGEQWSEGSSIEYGEEVEPSPAREAETAEEEREEAPSLFSDEDLERLDRGSADVAEGPGTAGGESGPAEPAGEGRAEGGGAAPEGVEGDVNVQFSREGVDRKLLETVQPKLTPDELANLPKQIPVRVAFTLTPAGRLTDLNIVTGSGDTRVDNKVKTAVRQWRFESIESADAAGGELRDVTGTITLILRKR